MEFDIVVSGGSFSAPAAALAAARINPDAQVLLVEPADWLGGQATTQGVAAIDNAWHAPGAAIMRDNPPLYYPTDYLDFLNRLKNPPAEAPGHGMAPSGSAWVTREAFDPRTAAWLLEQMIAEQPNITLLKLTVVKAVASQEIADAHGPGRHITGLTLVQRTPINGYVPFSKFLSQEIADWYDTNDSADFAKQVHTVAPRDAAKGLVVIDASELGDVMVLSGALYTVGRELTTEKIAEDGTLPDYDEAGTQSFVYPFCMTDAPSPDPETMLKSPFADFDAYYQQQVDTFFSLGAHSWNRVWTYRRLKNAGAVDAYDTVNTGDVTMQNWYPGNDYPYGSMFKSRADATDEAADWQGGIHPAELANAEKHAVAWYFHMKANRTTTWDTHYLRGGHPLNMMGTEHGLAKFPYMRGTRRLVGLDNFRLTERYFVNAGAADYPGGTSFRFYDSVGIGNYAVDIHPTKTSTGISPSLEKAAPFYIPYRALGSANVRNLLASGKTMAQTYVTNAAYRLHPIEWASGSAAGTAAALMLRDSRSNHELLEIAALRELQDAVRANSPIHWAAYDEQPVPPQNGDLVVNDLKPIVEGVPFQVEVYHHAAVRARVYLDGALLGETTTRANGRLVLDVPSAPTGAASFRADCFDADGNLLDTLGVPAPGDISIVDDEDARFSTTGAWVRGTAQPNKYAVSYRYSFGVSEPSTATWRLTVPVRGVYEIATWYPEAFNRAIDAPFEIHHAKGTQALRINQQLNGGQWLPLGEYEFSGAADERVVLSNDIVNPELLVVADAVRARLVRQLHGESWMVAGQ